MTRRRSSTALLAKALGRGVACAVTGAGVVAGGTAAGQVVPKERPAPVRDLEIRDKRGEQMPSSLQFKDHTGRIVSLGSYFNRPTGDGKGKKPVVVQLMYFRCPILCPTVLGKFTQTLKELSFSAGQDYDVLLVSVDHRDTPEDAARQREAQLAAYGRDPDISARGWNYLVGPESARTLADAVGFEYRWVPEAKEYAHGAALFVLTPEGKLSRTLTGLNYPAQDVKLALLEASGGKIGSVFDSFTLWCYHFNPETGSYSLAAMRVMQAAGGATVLVLGGFLGAMFAHERLRRRWRGDASGGPRPAKSPSDRSAPDRLPDLAHSDTTRGVAAAPRAITGPAT
jgi:protein SCO1/2